MLIRPKGDRAGSILLDIVIFVFTVALCTCVPAYAYESALDDLNQRWREGETDRRMRDLEARADQADLEKWQHNNFSERGNSACKWGNCD